MYGKQYKEEFMEKINVLLCKPGKRAHKGLTSHKYNPDYRAQEVKTLKGEK